MRLYAIVVLLALIATPLVAQGPAPLGLRTIAVPTSEKVQSRDSKSESKPDSIPPNEWKRGALIGGAIGAGAGLLISVVAAGLCHGLSDSEGPCTFHPMLVIAPAALFGVIGGMIGAGSHPQ